ncbi:EspA/EspE family type VII secretion system effector [Mycobacterium sp. NPDC050551]|uniref:TPR repeat region-containing protein n=1 Tax=Mycobacterium sp. NPDC050551 TaxID=3155407 RepID=UPI00342100F9
MSALDGFYATWNDARNTFGEGTPQGGAQIDASAKLGQLGTDVQAAAPGDTWTGAASEAYGGANKKHGDNLTKLADLDRRLAAQMDQAADVVTTGRSNLDAVRQWVTDAANSVPPGKQRDELLMKIANSGLGQVSEIVQTSNDANNTIRDNMNKLKPEFESVNFSSEGSPSGDPGDDKETEERDRLPRGTPTGESESEGEQDGEAVAEQADLPPDQQDPAVLDQVADNLPETQLTQAQIDALARGEEVSDVPPETLDYYRDFYQAAGKDGLLALDRHLEAQEAAGDTDAGAQRDRLSNGLMMTSNENIVEKNPDGSIAARGGYDQLPSELRDFIEWRNGDAIPNELELGTVAAQEQNVADMTQLGELFGEANPGFQPGTQLGTEMYQKAADMVEPNRDGWGFRETSVESYERAANNYADVAGRNNEASYRIWSGDGMEPGYNAEHTVRTLMGQDWSNAGGGTGAATLLDWMNEDMDRPVGDPIGDRARQAFTEVPHMLAPGDNDPVFNTMRDSFAHNDAVSTEMAQLLAENTGSLAGPGTYANGYPETTFDSAGNPVLAASEANRLLELGSYSEEGRVTLAHAAETARIDELAAAMRDNPGNIQDDVNNSPAGSLSGRIDNAMLDAIGHHNEVFQNEMTEEQQRDAVYRAKILGAELAGVATDELAGKIPGAGTITDVTGLAPGDLVENQIKEAIGTAQYEGISAPHQDDLGAGANRQAQQAILQAAYDAGQLPPELAPNGQPINLSGQPLAPGSPEAIALDNFLDSRGLNPYVENYGQSYKIDVGG